MPVNKIIPSIEPNNNSKIKVNHAENIADSSQVSFQGGTHPVVAVMDVVDRGGFAGAFILQDFLGMAAPRTAAGIYRNHDKTGEYNWDFARREGIREILSGPSVFLIPMAMLPFFKKFSGAANNVPIDFINGFGETVTKMVKGNKKLLATEGARTDIYREFFKNILNTSTEGKIKNLDSVADDFAKRLIEIHDPNLSPSKSLWKRLTGKAEPTSRQDKLAQLIEDFVGIRKRYLGLDANPYGADFKFSKGNASASLNSITKYIRDYTDDLLHSAGNAAKKAKNFNVEEFVKSLSVRRTGSRLVTNLAMFSGVVSFYTIIPKLYNMGIKRDPGLDGLDSKTEQPKSKNPSFGSKKKIGAVNEKTQNDKAQDVAFTGLSQKAFTRIGNAVNNNPKVKSKFLNHFEFDGASMTPTAVLALLFGFCLPPRLKNAKTEYEYKEIVERDITSFLAILFAGKALARGFSKLMTKYSGLALSQNPAKHSTFFEKFKNYFSNISGINVFNSDQIVAKYSNLRPTKLKGGFSTFIEFINKNGGNIQKVLGGIDETVAKSVEKILGKPVKEASVSEITKAFKNAHKTHPKEMEAIYRVFDARDNKFISRAKLYNSSFGLISNLVLVPALMISLAKHCEHMTAKRYAQNNKNAQQVNPSPSETMTANVKKSQQPTMEGFLKNKQAV